ncbi:hypothetical protein GCM10010912_04260 [Paenibacillus albidus]|uniref:Uncharacterized protein n=1 Tax=Paenibacillus albidus TaxID=2041023 RepID=A0A917BZ97_9BACL|nr:hypothetical protein [Paenibacillus albidus]MBT2292737.1 hypothetical protein [Paenibacillus albidus]GGF62263.1 hypothetical protein GCM10010912_04260 [Paenibacillus albidus]
MEHTSKPDKNLINTVKDLEQAPVNSHQAQQMEQKENDRRKKMIGRNAKFKENEHNTYK